MNILLGNYFLEKSDLSYIKNVFRMDFATISGWSVLTGVRARIIRKELDTLKCLRHVMRAMWYVRSECSHRCVSSGNPFKTCVNPQASDLNINRANLYENKMV